MYKCDKVEKWLDKVAIGEAQANDIAQIVVSSLPQFNGAKPVVVFLNHHVTRRVGYCYGNPKSKFYGKIGLPLEGQNWGTLAHEIAHLTEGAKHHDAAWYNCCIEVRQLLAEMCKNAEGHTY
jgi:hypothetical protein